MDGNVPSVSTDSDQFIAMISDGAIVVSGGFSADGPGEPAILIDQTGTVLATIESVDPEV